MAFVLILLGILCIGLLVGTVMYAYLEQPEWALIKWHRFMGRRIVAIRAKDGVRCVYGYEWVSPFGDVLWKPLSGHHHPVPLQPDGVIVSYDYHKWTYVDN